MQSTLVLTSLLIAFIWALNSVAQKHAVNKMSYPTAMAVFAVMYFVVMLVYIGYHKELISKEIQNIIPSAIFLMMAAVYSTLLPMFCTFDLSRRMGFQL